VTAFEAVPLIKPPASRGVSNYLMRVKTSITLPTELLKNIDRTESNRSAFFERAARAYLAELNKAKRDARDMAIINSNADRLNAEALDVLDYQDFP
jgi:metal-responsive CopG/Arc/MetJ family transcriptional regulator